MQRRAKQQNNARNINCIALLNHNSAAVAFSQIRDQADRRQKLKWLHYQDTLRPRYVCTKSNLAFSTNLMLSTNPLVFSTKSNLHQMAPTTPSQTAFFTFFLCIFNLSRAILGAVWINLILPQNGGLCIQIIDSTQGPCDQVLKLNALYRGKSDNLELDPSKVTGCKTWTGTFKSIPGNLYCTNPTLGLKKYGTAKTRIGGFAGIRFACFYFCGHDIQYVC